MSGIRALLVVDVQPTFCEGGELPVPGGNDCAERIASFVSRHAGDYDLVVTSQDWHRDPGSHFSADPDFVDSWPRHGLAGTAAAEIHPAVATALAAVTVPRVAVRKGEHAAAYSAFDGSDENGRSLSEVLRQRGVSAIDIVGIAESHCVRYTALDARADGLSARVLCDLTVPVSPELGAEAREAMRAAGAELIGSDGEPCAPYPDQHGA